MPYHCQRLVILAGILAVGPLASPSAAQHPPAPGMAADSSRARFQDGNVAPVPASPPQPFVFSPPPQITQPKLRAWKRAWIASWVAFAVINALDAHSSAGRVEANPLLRNANGTFSGKRAALLKSGAGAGFLAVQWWVGRENPEHYRVFTIANTALDGGLAAIVVRNYGLASASAAAPGYVLR